MKHNSFLYNNLLFLSRNIFFYKSLKLKDNFETRLYLMFFHYSLILIIFKKKKYKIDQENYNSLFFNIENNLRELGFGDVSVNKKMKVFNNIFYDILIKINVDATNFELNKEIVIKYFDKFAKNNEKIKKFELYFEKFYEFCFDLSYDNMIEDIRKFKF